MFKTLTTQLDTILDQLTLLVDKNASTLTEPVLLIHPPNLRNAHVSFLQTRQAAFESLLTSILTLEKKTASIRTKIHTQHRSCILAQAPVSSLPDELLGSIFSFAVESSQYGGLRRGPLSIATAISKVCRRWHFAATSLRSLWTDIRLSKHSLHYADQTFQRSVVEPITLRISDGACMPISRYLDAELRRRLRELTIDSSESLAIFESLARIQRDGRKFTALEYLDLSENSSLESVPRFLTKISMPKLRTLRLCGLLLTSNLRAEHLTSIELSDQSYYSFGEVFCTFLKNTPRLRTIVLNSIRTRTRWTTPDPAVLEDLRHVEIRNGSRQCFVEALMCLRAPHLETFITEDPDGDDTLSDSDDGDSDDEGPLDEDSLSLRETFRRALGRLFVDSDSLNQISTTATSEVSGDLLMALKRRTPANSGAFSECRAPNLKNLQVILPEYGESKESELDALIKMLASTVVRRADFGSHLAKLVVSECLTETVYWDIYIPDEIAQMAETEPCMCDSHSMVFSSEEDESDSDSVGGLDHL